MMTRGRRVVGGGCGGRGCVRETDAVVLDRLVVAHRQRVGVSAVRLVAGGGGGRLAEADEKGADAVVLEHEELFGLHALDGAKVPRLRLQAADARHILTRYVATCSFRAVVVVVEGLGMTAGEPPAVGVLVLVADVDGVALAQAQVLARAAVVVVERHVGERARQRRRHRRRCGR